MVAYVDNANVRHRSKTSDDGSDMKTGWDDSTRNLKSRERRTSSVFGAQATFSIFAFFIGIVILCMRYDAKLPEPVSIADAGQREGPVFIQERARMMLKEMTNYGPRPTGSYENEVLTVEFLKFRLQMINQTVDRRFHEMKVDVQVVSGSFSMAFINDFASQYANVQNVVVKLEPSRAAGGSTGHAILINCHFDTAPFSPGASDDAASCVTMLEVLSVIAQSPLKLKHTLIFLFNGAEENLLQGSHGFVTQHPWAKEVRVFINLEACGSGGREVVFQAGPERYWLAEAYREAAVHPFASVIGQDVFESGLIPSDTDFRIFRDFGGLSGLDIAFVVNGYVYHTAYDTEDRLPAGSLQRAGDNVLSIVLHLANSSRMGEESGENLCSSTFWG